MRRTGFVLEMIGTGVCITKTDKSRKRGPKKHGERNMDRNIATRDGILVRDPVVY